MTSWTNGEGSCSRCLCRAGGRPRARVSDLSDVWAGRGRLGDGEGFALLSQVALGGVLIVPVGWVLARVLRIAHPFRSALLGPVLLLVFRNAVALVVSHPRPNHALLGFTVLAVMSYSGAAVLTRTVSLIPRIIAAGLVCACVITTSTIEARQVEARERKHREQLIADFDKSVPLAVPDVVPGRMLVKVWTIDGVGHQAKSVLALDYAKEPDSGPDVMVRITENGDPRESCLAWVQGNTDGANGWRRIDG